MKAIIKMQQQSIKSMEISKGAVEEFIEHVDTFMPRTVWSTGCRVSAVGSKLVK